VEELQRLGDHPIRSLVGRIPGAELAELHAWRGNLHRRQGDLSIRTDDHDTPGEVLFGNLLRRFNEDVLASDSIGQVIAVP
jgi:hypothetical protein